MINLKRFPGVLYRYKVHFVVTCGAVTAAGLFIVYFMHRWGFVCSNREINAEIDKLCKLYEAEEAVGNLCEPLCQGDLVHSISCVSQHLENQIAFTANWRKKLIVVKSATKLERIQASGPDASSTNGIKLSQTLDKKNLEETLEVYPLNLLKSQILGESDDADNNLELEIRNLVAEKLNMSLTREQLNSLRYLETGSGYGKSVSATRRRAEKKNVLELLNSREYLLSRLFSDKEVFPRVLGTCGHFYALEYLESPSFDSVFALDDKAEWSERMKLAIAIMDFVEILETDFPDALYLCDVRMNHIGVTKLGRVKFLNGNSVYPKSVLDGTLKSDRRCLQHKDCDFIDCRSTCNVNEGICDAGVVNDNLQVICEKIFIGWTLSGKVIIPGLLMSENTPASLSALLRLCAENGRQSVPEDLRQRLYNILTEMHQILVQRLLSA